MEKPHIEHLRWLDTYGRKKSVDLIDGIIVEILLDRLALSGDTFTEKQKGKIRALYEKYSSRNGSGSSA